MGSRTYVNISTVNGVSFYAGNGDPNGSLSATRGSFYSDKLTGTAYMNTNGATLWVALGAGGGGVRSTFVWRGAGPSNPAAGVYDTFAGAHAAAAAVEGFKTIVYDNAGVTYNIVPGTYDMSNIQLLGDNSVDPNANQILIEDGAVFTNWSNGAPFCWLQFDTQTIRAITIPAGSFSLMRSGEASRWSTSNTGGAGLAPILIEDTASLSFIFDNLTAMDGDIDGGSYVEIFQIDGPAGALAVNVFNRVTPSDNLYRGSGFLSIVISGGEYGGFIPPNNANFSGTSDVPIGSTYYDPATPIAWGIAPPPNVKDALDRIASGEFGIASAFSSSVGTVQPQILALGLTKTGLAANSTNVEFGFNTGGNAYGPSVEQVTDTVLNDEVYLFEPAQDFSRTAQPLFVDIFASSNWTDQRFYSGFVGAAGVAALASDNPAGDQAALQFSTARGDLTFQVALRNAGAQVLIDTGITPTNNTVYKWVMDMTDSRLNMALYEVGAGSTMTNVLLWSTSYTTMADVWNAGSWLTGLRTLAAIQNGLTRLQTWIAGARLTLVN